LNRKLLLLDVVLMAVLVYAGSQFRDLYREKKARETAQRNVKVIPVPPPPAPAPPPSSTVLATTYAPIAQKLLLSKDRNPDVPIEVPPPPPPPPPMPPLPGYHGMMNFGDAEGTIAIMSLPNSKAQKSIHAGETIGEFKLLAVSKDGIDLQWRDQKVHKALEELTSRAKPEEAAPAAAASAAPAAPRAPAPPPAERGPDEKDQGGGIHRCQDNDTTPAGAVVNGLRKVMKPGPFGQVCYWEPVGR
jgi:hypothetical protein